jgi:hypothetical protein
MFWRRRHDGGGVQRLSYARDSPTQCLLLSLPDGFTPCIHGVSIRLPSFPHTGTNRLGTIGIRQIALHRTSSFLTTCRLSQTFVRCSDTRSMCERRKRIPLGVIFRRKLRRCAINPLALSHNVSKCFRKIWIPPQNHTVVGSLKLLALT